MDFIVFKFSNGNYLKKVGLIDYFSCDFFSVTDDIKDAWHLSKTDYLNLRKYFDVFDGCFTEFKITEVGKCN